MGLGMGQGDTYLCFSNSLCEDLLEREKHSSLQRLTTARGPAKGPGCLQAGAEGLGPRAVQDGES